MLIGSLIIALPTDMFYNTGISTYIWIVSNRKPAARKGKLQLIDASGFWQKMRKSLGSKRKELSPDHIEDITRLFGKFKIGYEIPFNRHFYVFQPPRPLAEIDADLKGCTDRILTMIGGLTK